MRRTTDAAFHRSRPTCRQPTDAITGALRAARAPRPKGRLPRIARRPPPAVGGVEGWSLLTASDYGARWWRLPCDTRRAAARGARGAQPARVGALMRVPLERRGGAGMVGPVPTLRGLALRIRRLATGGSGPARPQSTTEAVASRDVIQDPSAPEVSAASTAEVSSRDGASPQAPDAAPDEDRTAAAAIKELSEGGDHRAAIARAERELDRIESHPHPDARLLREIQMAATRGGATTLHRRTLRRRVALAPHDENLRRFLKSAEGRWRETEPGWLPEIDDETLAALPRSQGQPTGRILHLLKIGMPQRQSGYSMRSMYTLSGQLAAGLDPVAVTALDFPRSIGVDDAPEVDTVSGVRYRHLFRDAIPEKEAPDDYLTAYANALLPVVAEEAPDLIHVHSGHRGTEAALVALAVGRALDIPVVYEVRGFFEALWTKDLAWAEEAEIYHRRRAAEAHVLRQSAAVVTLSESMKQDIVGRGVDPGHVHVVPNGVDPGAFVPVERDHRLAAELGLSGRFVFGYVSNLDHYREGQELLIDAALELRRRGVEATALIVGDGARRELLEEHARSRQAGDAVHFTGKVPHDKVGDYYAQLDVFVIPRIDERAARLVTPLKPYEAMALGIPLVVSDLPALQEITGDGARGETFATGDASALADVLEGLAKSPERRRELSDGAREWVLSHRTWGHNDRRYAEVYGTVMTGADAGSVSKDATVEPQAD